MTIVARSGDDYSGFAPYVPSIDDAGVVAFQAELPNGETTVVFGERRFRSATYYSHPDINTRGDVCVYASLSDGRKAVLLNDEPIFVGDVGPLGPTMNEDGDVAFRSDGAIFLWRMGEVVEIARGEFHGLPVLNDLVEVAYRHEGGISVWREGKSTLEVDIREFEGMGNFPHLNARGDFCFVCNAGVFALIGGQLQHLVREGFESYRGALRSSSGHLVFYATPPGGQLGIYRECSPTPLIEIGSPFEGSTVEEFALNPVSINEHGVVVARVKLEDGRHFIVCLT